MFGASVVVLLLYALHDRRSDVCYVSAQFQITIVIMLSRLGYFYYRTVGLRCSVGVGELRYEYYIRIVFRLVLLRTFYRLFHLIIFAMSDLSFIIVNELISQILLSLHFTRILFHSV